MTSKFLIPKVRRDDSCSDSSSNENVRISSTPGRKRKLDHLTFEEKVQRKKLKNRVAAQTSRDRKKKQMEEMQDTIELQNEQISKLEHRCDQLTSERDKIIAKYEKLEKDYQKLKAKNNCKQQETRHHNNNIPEEHKYTRSALEETSVDSCVGSLSIKTEGSAESPRPLLKVSKMEIESTKRSTKVHSQKKSDAKALLKELLEDIEFDQFDLEQLAESLLEDVSSNLETGVSPGRASNAKGSGREQPLSQPLVGTEDSRVESAKDCCLIKTELIDDDDVTPMTFDVDETFNENRIIYADEIPVEDECLEIQDSPEICLTFKSEPMDGLLSPIPSYDEVNLKSPINTISDCGYESHGSPVSHHDFTFNDQTDDLNYLLNDLFPALA